MAGLLLLAVGVLLLIIVMWHRMGGRQEYTSEEIVRTLDGLIQALDHDRLIAKETAFPKLGWEHARAGVGAFRNPTRFWEPGFREATKKMRRK